MLNRTPSRVEAPLDPLSFKPPRRLWHAAKAIDLDSRLPLDPKRPPLWRSGARRFARTRGGPSCRHHRGACGGDACGGDACAAPGRPEHRPRQPPGAKVCGGAEEKRALGEAVADIYIYIYRERERYRYICIYINEHAVCLRGKQIIVALNLEASSYSARGEIGLRS